MSAELDPISTLHVELAKIQTMLQNSGAERREQHKQQADALAAFKEDTAKELAEIKTQAKLTNGRVSRLEDWQQRVLGAAGASAVIYGVATDLFGLLAKH